MHALTSATGAVFGMNLPDDKLPLLKSMTIDYTRVAKGDLRGVAALSPQDKAVFLSDPKVRDTCPLQLGLGSRVRGESSDLIRHL